MHLEVAWNDAAAAMIAAQKPVAEAVMLAERRRMEGDREGAEAALLAHATDPSALRQLRDYAAQDGAWARARDPLASAIRVDGGC